MPRPASLFAATALMVAAPSLSRAAETFVGALIACPVGSKHSLRVEGPTRPQCNAALAVMGRTVPGNLAIVACVPHEQAAWVAAQVTAISCKPASGP